MGIKSREGSQVKCMRCGTEIQSGSVFCEECLADMEKHPIKPGTPINLPRREKQQTVKRSKKRFQKPEDHIHALRRLVAWLMAVIILLVLALTASIYLLVTQPDQNNGARLPGQNYGTSVDGI